MEKEPRIRPAGDQALLVEFGEEISPALNREVHAFVRRAAPRKIPGIGEMVPSYSSVLVYYESLALSFAETASWVREFLTALSSEPDPSGTVKEVPVLYGGEFGPDISYVAGHNGISVDEVIRLHTGESYLVYVVGFSPGFAAMGSVPRKIQAPRLSTPRTKVPAGSVGIGGQQTGIYAVESPGGWQLIGRTPLNLFNLTKNPPSFFQPGDYARFYAIDEKDFLRIQNSGVGKKSVQFSQAVPATDPLNNRFQNCHASEKSPLIPLKL
jgi:KipI family sensor histidine kinase inhibitor